MNNNINSLKENYSKVVSNLEKLGSARGKVWNNKRRNK